MISDTFSAEDVIRIYCMNLENEEKDIVRKFITSRETDCKTFVDSECEKCEDELDECEKMKIKIKIKLVDLNVNLNKYLLLACAAETLADVLLSDDKAIEKSKEIEQEINNMCQSIVSNSEAVDEYAVYIPRGRNRVSFNDVVSNIENISEDIIKDNAVVGYLEEKRQSTIVWIEGKEQAMKVKAKELESEIKVIQKEGRRLLDDISIILYGRK